MNCFVVKMLRGLVFALAVKVSGSILEGEVEVVVGELDPFDGMEGEVVVLVDSSALLGLEVLGPFDEPLVGVQVQRLSLKPGFRPIL